VVDRKAQFMPVLLDRLTDEFPDRRSETGKLGISRTDYYNAVIRDLAWLLNSTQFESQDSLTLPPRVRNSTLNYGLAPISGRRYSELDLPEIAKSIRHAVATFEPRILADTVVVSPCHDPVSNAHNLAVFEISAKLWFEPSPIDLYVRTELDMEAGHAIVVGR
jgi:type VI secretion system protein ImpF